MLHLSRPLQQPTHMHTATHAVCTGCCSQQEQHVAQQERALPPCICSAAPPPPLSMGPHQFTRHLVFALSCLLLWTPWQPLARHGCPCNYTQPHAHTTSTP